MTQRVPPMWRALLSSPSSCNSQDPNQLPPPSGAAAHTPKKTPIKSGAAARMPRSKSPPGRSPNPASGQRCNTIDNYFARDAPGSVGKPGNLPDPKPTSGAGGARARGSPRKQGHSGAQAGRGPPNRVGSGSVRAAACQTTETAETRAHGELEADAERKRLCELAAYAACAPCPALWLVLLQES